MAFKRDDELPPTHTIPLARLVWTDMDGTAHEQMLAHQEVIIGRSADCTIQILDALVSRQHAALRWYEGGFIITDLGSVNGILRNGLRIQQTAVLEDGDQFVIGPLSFRFGRSLAETFPSMAAAAGQEGFPAGVMRLPCLEVVTGPQRGMRFELDRETMTIGRPARGQHFDILLQDHAVSRPHARIERIAGSYHLTDIGSANGTLVNNQRIDQTVRLEDGDSIIFGEAVLIFRSGKLENGDESSR